MRRKICVQIPDLAENLILLFTCKLYTEQDFLKNNTIHTYLTYNQYIRTLVKYCLCLNRMYFIHMS